jgi:hypothetical protein
MQVFAPLMRLVIARIILIPPIDKHVVSNALQGTPVSSTATLVHYRSFQAMSAKMGTRIALPCLHRTQLFAVLWPNFAESLARLASGVNPCHSPTAAVLGLQIGLELFLFPKREVIQQQE